MTNHLLSIFKGLMLFMLMLISHLGAAPMTFESTYIRLPDHVPSKAVNNATFLQHLDADTNVQITFVLPLRKPKELQALIERISNPAEQQYYGNYLSTTEFIDEFSPLQEDYDKVIAYAQNIGLTVQGIHPNRTLLNVSGSAEIIESAFNIRLQQYQLPNGRQFYAADNNPEVPLSIAFVVSGIVGLDNYARWHAHHRIKEVVTSLNVASHAVPSGPGGSFAPNDILKAYNFSGISSHGSNQNIALFELAQYQVSDISFYTNFFGLPPANLKNVLVDGGNFSGINAEVTLDIQLALALAPQSTIYVYEGPNSGQGVLDTYNRIATDNIAKQVSTSWGLGEDRESTQFLQAENAIFQQMAAQGQTIYSASGDSGAYDDYPSQALVVDDPSSQPYVIGVGGTSLAVNSQTGAYQSETVWNNGLGNGAGGGGVSAVWPIPSWQVNVPTASSHTHRNVPDVALDSDPNTGYIVYHGGQWLIVGGTSCAAPLWAAFTACVNQGLAAVQQPPLGFANPKFYTIGAGGTYTADFHDVMTGDNLFFPALQGYDNATGWGSFNATNLYKDLIGNNNTLPTVTITSPASGATVSGTVVITVNAQDSMGVSKVEFYVDSLLLGTDLTAPYSFSLNTITLANGLHTISAIAYNAAGNHAQDQITVTVQNSSVDNIPPTVQIQSPAGGSTVSGTVNFSAMATDNVAVKQVDFNVDGVLQQRVMMPPYTTLVDTTKLTNGQHSFQAIAYDTSNNTAQQTISVNVSNQGGAPPTVVIASPPNNSYVGGTIFVNVSASDAVGIARVELYLDCKIWATDFTAPYTFSIDTSKIAQMQHVLTAIAYDNAGRSSQNSIIINVQN